MDHVGWLADVYGPRLAGTPQLRQASEWAMKRFTEWGLSNVHQERFAFGQGWKVERWSAHMIEPQTQPIIGYPRTFSPSTKGPVSGDVDARRHSIRSRLREVRRQAPRQDRPAASGAGAVRMLDGRIVLRMNEKDIAEALTTPIPEAAAGGGAGGAAAGFQQKVAQFYVTEGVAALLERGSDSDTVAGGSNLSWQAQRVDGGYRVARRAAATAIRKCRRACPSATIAVEHYNRMLRILDKGLPVKVEVNIQTTFFPEAAGTLNGINTIAEIPGTDLADEVVIVGAHYDTHPFATGATDNATGSTAMMEAVRVIKSLGLRPRRTIRVALWDGEEHGLARIARVRRRALRQPADGTTKPGHAKFVAYYNLDNGTGRIRGIWGQGNLGAMALFRQWMESVKDLGVEIVGPRSVQQTDHMSFDNAGLPGFQFIQERLEYDSRTHHSTMDFVDRVQREDLVQQATVVAVFAWYSANWPEKLPRKAVATKAGTQ